MGTCFTPFTLTDKVRELRPMGKGLSPRYTDGQWYYILNFNGLLGVSLFASAFILFFFFFSTLMKIRLHHNIIKEPLPEPNLLDDDTSVDLESLPADLESK